ncbi:DNA repair photolyase [Lachnospiraceae bacterium XBB1006]|nr:DNA repair photolyase [Lachnospiraceae bacterium XBB1006]
MHFVEAKSLLTKWGGMNIYRGCAHGCVYCDSRSDCYQFTHPFEDIEVKENAPELLEKILKSKRKKCMIGSGSMCDPYQSCEKELQLTRKCLKLLDQYEFGAAVITKSDLVLRDMDLFCSIHEKAKAVVQMTLTIADEELSKKLEPGVCNTKRRYEVLKEFQKNRIPTVVWMSPFLPYLTDSRENVETIMEYCFDAGVKGIINYGIGMTLRAGDREYYYQALDKHFPGLSRKYQEKFGYSYEINSEHNAELMRMFHEQCEKRGVLHTPEDCFRYMQKMPERYEQMTLDLD